MVIKIFFEDKPVFLCNEITPSIHKYMHHPDAIFIDEITTPAINSLLHEIAKPEFHAGILWNDNIDKLKKAFYKHFTMIQAAGGVVKNEMDEILFIFRKGNWDLPKGKNDGNEIAKECALREVKEETGLVKVKVGKKVCTTYHTYHEFGKHILKETEWFDMKATSQQKLIPQQEEGIQKIEWVSKLNIPDKLKKSYPLITDVLISLGIDIKI
ncbi:MAG: NUDIX domain-containing protein [Ginsengibacter sp.]